MILLHDGQDVVTYFENSIRQYARNECGERKINNTWRFLRFLAGTGMAPIPLKKDTGMIEMEYIPYTSSANKIRSQVNVVRHLIYLLKNNIFHGNISKEHIKFRNDSPVFIGWGNARFGWEQTENSLMDSDFVLPQFFRPTHDWMVIRPYIMHLRGYGVVWHIGESDGNITALAQADGFTAVGLGKKLSFAKARWQNSVFIDRIDLPSYHADVVILSEDLSDDQLSTIINSCGVLFYKSKKCKVETAIYLRKFARTVIPIGEGIWKVLR